MFVDIDANTLHIAPVERRLAGHARTSALFVFAPGACSTQGCLTLRLGPVVDLQEVCQTPIKRGMYPAGGNGSTARQIAEQQLQMMQMAVGGSSEIRLPEETAKRIPSRLDWDTSILDQQAVFFCARNLGFTAESASFGAFPMTAICHWADFSGIFCFGSGLTYKVSSKIYSGVWEGF